jgi:Xaa-Pro aminopeptidase
MADLTKLRELLKKENISAYIIPTEDAHQSEYIADCDKRREYISGFTGSAGSAVVTLDHAALWTDGRYYLQAEKELGEGWTLMKGGLPTTPTQAGWLKTVLPADSAVGYDPQLFSKTTARTNETQINQAGLKYKPVLDNLVDKVWENKPKSPSANVFVHTVKYAGESHSSKLAKVREYLKSNKVDAVVIAALDEVAWLFNLRGSDISFNPVFISYAVVTVDKAHLFVNPSKLTDEVKAHLGNEVQIHEYDAVFDFVKKLSDDKKVIALDPAKCNMKLFGSVSEESTREIGSPITHPKGIKNEVELEGMRQAHVRDAVAMVKFFTWLENELKHGKKHDEVSIADKLEQFRSQQKDYVSLSFDTIAGSGGNGAIIHYHAHKETCAAVTADKLLLLDSGAQYRDGTTDVTRTVHFGTPSAEEKHAYTRVLQGHIGLDRAVFPDGTSGGKLDILARAPLWQSGLEYRHGTGHGVGAFLNVHEGPHGISFRDSAFQVALKPGMIVTNEPGYYEDGKFGVRIESVLIVKEVKTPHNFGGAKYFGFEHITMVPIQTKLIDTALMSPVEIAWVNSFNKECYDKLAPLLSDDQPALEWLKKETKAI